MTRKPSFLVCPSSRNQARRQCFLVCPRKNVSWFVHLPRNMPRRQCFLVCLPSRNLARKQCFLVFPHWENKVKYVVLFCPVHFFMCFRYERSLVASMSISAMIETFTVHHLKLFLIFWNVNNCISFQTVQSTNVHILAIFKYTFLM